MPEKGGRDRLVRVKGFTRAGGTRVKGYDRRAPGEGETAEAKAKKRK